MKTITVFDPPMCCSTGVCGTDVDPELAAFAGFLDELRKQKFGVHRYNLGQEPMAFVENPLIKELLEKEGTEALPVILVDDSIFCKGRYPNPEEQTSLVSK